MEGEVGVTAVSMEGEGGVKSLMVSIGEGGGGRKEW